MTDSSWTRGRRAFATTSLVRRAADALEDRGHAPLAAAATARAVVDPAALRRGVQHPSEREVEGGTLFLVHAQVWTYAVIPAPTNPRLGNHLAYPFGGAPEPGHWEPLPALRAHDEGFGLALTVESPDHLVRQLERVIEVLADENPWDILGGIRSAVTLVPMVIEHKDGSDAIGVAAAADGSSRIGLTHRLHGLRARDSLYHLAGAASLRSLRGRTGDVLALGEQDQEDLSDDERAKLRTVSMPADIVVGWLPRPGSAVGLPLAVASLVGQTHLDPPKGWPDESRLDEEINVVASLLEAKRRISATERAYLEATMTPTEAQAAGLPSEYDRRSIFCLRTLAGTKHRRTVLRGLRSVLLSDRAADDGERVKRGERLEIAVEAAVRPVRQRHSRKEAERARIVLGDVWSMPELKDDSDWDPDWEIGDEDLLHAALDECDAGTLGPNGRQLLAQAAFWLSANGVLRPTTRGGEADRRPPVEVLRQCMRSPYGIRQLHQVVLDGRAGILLRKVRRSGKLAVNDEGSEIKLLDRHLREDIAPPKARRKSRPGAPESVAPESAFYEAKDSVRTCVDALLDAMDELKSVKDEDGAVLVDEQGLAPTFVDALAPRLGEAEADLRRMAWIWSQKHDSGAPVSDDDESEAA